MPHAGGRTAYIVTGTTRGIGKALAEAIAARGHLLQTLSRAPARRVRSWRNHFCDLRFPDQVRQAMTRLLKGMNPADSGDVVLISNAGVLEPIGFIERLTADQIAAHMQVNLLSPVHLVGLFIEGTRTWRCRRRVILVTSGAGRHPYAGWSLYCGSKAGLDMVMRCAALEQKQRPDGVSICAVAPGVVATGMQGEIRAADDADFPARARFLKFQEGGLPLPQQVAATLLDLDAGGQLVSGGLYDLRDVVWQEGRPTIEPRLLDP